MLFLLGSASIFGVSASSFDADYKSAMGSAIARSLDRGSGRRPTVAITSVQDSGTTQRTLSTGAVFVFYEIVVVLEEYGGDANSIFGIIDTTLKEAQQSSVLLNTMKDILITTKGYDVPELSVDNIFNDEDAIVFTVLRTPTPSVHPTVAPTGGGRNNGGGSLQSTIIIVIVSIVVACVVIAGVAYFFWSANEGVIPEKLTDVRRQDGDYAADLSGSLNYDSPIINSREMVGSSVGLGAQSEERL